MDKLCCDSASNAPKYIRPSKKGKKTLKHVNKMKKNLSKLGINPLDDPTKFVMVGNAGHGTGLQEAQLIRACLPYGTVEAVVMIPGMAYCFVVFTDVAGAKSAYEALHGEKNPVSTSPRALYLAYVETVSGCDSVCRFDMKPPGLLLYEDFVMEAEEELLLNCVNWNTICHSGKVLRQRRVKHYGYEFNYDTNNVDKACPLTENIPSECEFLWLRLKQRGCDIVRQPPDQLTVNHYEPGHGIPQHVDAHSAFEDPIISLSLGAPVVMDFKHPDGRHAAVVLSRRSLLVMSGEARYGWSHGITARRTDIMPSSAGGLMVQDRSARTSFTFRCIRLGECVCGYPQQCDSYDKRLVTAAEPVVTDHVAATLESEHVHKVYEEIAGHFSNTRHKPWPNVLQFVQSMPPGAVLLDVGCGNGKYFGHNATIFEIGCDTCVELGIVCKQRGFEILNANCLHLPFVSGFADGCISIAVMHHLASQARRLRAVEEIVRILRPGGAALIYVWSKEQERGMEKSAYLKQDKRNNVNLLRESRAVEHLTKQNTSLSEENGKSSSVGGDGASVPAPPTDVNLTEGTCLCGSCVPPLPIHTNRTQFRHQDVFVPWIMKHSKGTEKSLMPTFYRYYHVFEEGELEKLCNLVDDCSVTKSYYDQGNWCVVLEKKCV